MTDWREAAQSSDEEEELITVGGVVFHIPNESNNVP